MTTLAPNRVKDVLNIMRRELDVFSDDPVIIEKREALYVAMSCVEIFRLQKLIFKITKRSSTEGRL